MKVEQLSSSDKAKLLSEMIGVPVTDSTLQVFKDALAHLGVVTALALNSMLSIIPQNEGDAWVRLGLDACQKKSVRHSNR
jgi:hypothetical protein